MFYNNKRNLCVNVEENDVFIKSNPNIRVIRDELSLRLILITQLLLRVTSIHGNDECNYFKIKMFWKNILFYIVVLKILHFYNTFSMWRVWRYQHTIWSVDQKLQTIQWPKENGQTIIYKTLHKNKRSSNTHTIKNGG